MEGFGSAQLGNTHMEAPNENQTSPPASVSPDNAREKSYALSKRMDGIVSTYGQRPHSSCHFNYSRSSASAFRPRPALLQFLLL
jgi:hypothetical protein